MSVRLPYSTLQENVFPVEDRDIQPEPKSKEEDFLTKVSAFAGLKLVGAGDELYESMISTFIDEAYVALTTRFDHFSDLEKEYFIKTPKVNIMFAKLVALCLRTSQTTSGNQYELDKIYMRINLEKKKVMNYFRNLKTMRRKKIAVLSLDDMQPF